MQNYYKFHFTEVRGHFSIKPRPATYLQHINPPHVMVLRDTKRLIREW